MSTSYRFSAAPPVIEQLPQATMSLGRERGLGTMTPSQVLATASGQSQAFGQAQGLGQSQGLQPLAALTSQQTASGREMRGATAALAEAGLTPMKALSRVNPVTGEQVQYIKVKDEMGNKCYVDISGTGGITSVSESMRMPMTEVERGSVKSQSRLAELAAMGALASGVMYECAEGMCAVTRVENNVPVETRYVSERSIMGPGMGGSPVPILPMQSVTGTQKSSLRHTLTKLNEKLREGTQSRTQESLKQEVKILADNTNSLNEFQIVRQQALEALRSAEAKIRDLLAQFESLEPAQAASQENMTKLATLRKELVTRLDMENSLEDMSTQLQSISPLSPQLKQESDKAITTIKKGLSAVEKPIVAVTSSKASQ